MRKLLFGLLFCGSLNAFSQCLSFQFAEIGYEPATCRLASSQIGFGVVYAAVTGGTEPYTYQWTNLQTGQTTDNSTWGGLNTGLYQIYVYDSLGCILLDTIEVDSVPVISDFEIVSSDFDSTGTFAFLPFEGQIKLTVPPCIYAQPAYPDPDTNYMWKIDPGVSWTVGQCWNGPPEFSLSSVGIYEITVVAINSNGCTDTATQILNAILPTYAPVQPTVFCDHTTGQVFIEIPENLNAVFVLYNLDGSVQKRMNLEPGMNTLQAERGISFYTVVSSATSEEILKGKLIHISP